VYSVCATLAGPRTSLRTRYFDLENFLTARDLTRITDAHAARWLRALSIDLDLASLDGLLAIARV
jgi:hypothetical protein